MLTKKKYKENGQEDEKYIKTFPLTEKKLTK